VGNGFEGTHLVLFVGVAVNDGTKGVPLQRNQEKGPSIKTTVSLEMYTFRGCFAKQ
jgi:hypothetical protein